MLQGVCMCEAETDPWVADGVGSTEVPEHGLH